MKNRNLLLLASVLVFCGSAWAQQTTPQLKSSAIETGYLPQGFDSNDNVQVVIEGYYRDTCSKPAYNQVRVNPASKTIDLQSYEYRYGGLCLDVIVPHDDVVNLGIVPPGVYRVQQTGGKQLGQMSINLSTKLTADDYLYAPISQAFARNMNGKVAVTLAGHFTNSCMKLVKVVSNTQGNVVTVQPLAELMNKRNNCVKGNYPFEQTVLVDNVKAGRYLLHVRSLNGNAINSLFDVN